MELNDILISPMREEDISSVALTERECFSLPWSEEALRSELFNENAIFFTAKLSGETAGYMGLHTVLDECYVANIAVREGFRRRGIGRRLLSYAEERAREKGCSFISLEVRVSNEGAVSLYCSQGYEIQGERKNFYSHPTENALIMTKILSR